MPFAIMGTNNQNDTVHNITVGHQLISDQNGWRNGRYRSAISANYLLFVVISPISMTLVSYVLSS